ncbi:MAG: hypothetical protein QMD14_04100 [Candidatus Aenigmarchaeota archaeon]|nr:hypothetical protein [Candidatus Aenigmarchaeota archaeon]
MERRLLLVLTLTISLVIFSTLTLALSCAVRFGACDAGEVCILSMNNTINSHAARCDYYGYKLCCSDIRNASIRATCLENENPILSINSTENAHVAQVGYYGYKVCVDWLNCSILDSCPSPLISVASLNNTINSHIAEPLYYGYKLCCGECDMNADYCLQCCQANLLPYCVPPAQCTLTSCWNLGGDLPGAFACCGDDANEYKLTRVCAVGVCDSDPSDDACCSLPDKCVYNSVCYPNGWVGDVDGDDLYEECDSGIWILKAPWWRILWRDIVEAIMKILKLG